MFRSSTIIRELALNLAEVIFMLKHSVKLRRYLLCGCVAACCIHQNARCNDKKNNNSYNYHHHHHLLYAGYLYTYS